MLTNAYKNMHSTDLLMPFKIVWIYKLFKSMNNC